MKPKVFVTSGKVPAVGIEVLKKYCEVEIYEGERLLSRTELKRRIRDVDAVLCQYTDKFDKEVLKVAKNLKVIGSCTAGYDNIDIDEATRRGIYVTYSPVESGVSETTAVFTWALILALARRIVEADYFVRSGKWRTWSPTLFLGTEIRDKILGIVGLGRIGTRVASIAKCFGMKVIYYDIVRNLEKEKELEITYCPLDVLLRESDFVSLHVPLTKETYHLIGEEQLKLMKPTAFLINTSRGPIVDEKALIRALEEKWIAGAALDVYEKEPIGKKHPLFKMPNVILTPHIGGAAKETRERMAESTARYVIQVLKGEQPKFLANPEVMKVRPLSEVKMIP
jgi:glyoxylate reductase